MRCAIETFIATAFAVLIAGCGDATQQGGTTSNGRGSQAEFAEYALESSSSDAAEPVVKHSGDDAPSEIPPSPRNISRTGPDVTRSVDREPVVNPAPIVSQRVDREKPQNELRAGTLTAGSIDDHARYDDFRNFLSNRLQCGSGPSFPNLNIGRRAVIRVTNEQGKGIGDARVTIQSLADNGQQPVAANAGYSTMTASDGRALFLSARDTLSADSKYKLTVEAPGRQQPVTRQVSLDDRDWDFVLDDTQQQLPTRLDLALVIDTTGSMQDELNYLKVEIDDIAAAIKQRFPNVEQRFALILYRDEGDRYVTRTFDFTGSLTEFRQQLSRQSAKGGGDYPEAMHLALEQAGRLSWQSTETARVLFLVGDAPPHPRFANRTMDAVESLREQNVKLFPIAASGVRDEAEWIMRSAAFLTMGRYLFLTDHSGIGNPHAKPQTPSFSVERLNALMVRMIASELAGRELLPSDIIATEESGGASAVQPDQQVDSPQSSLVDPMPVRPDTQSVTRRMADWFYAAIRWPAARFVAAILAIVLILKLDTRRHRVTT